jgi:hypothetical protein
MKDKRWTTNHTLLVNVDSILTSHAMRTNGGRSILVWFALLHLLQLYLAVLIPITSPVPFPFSIMRIPLLLASNLL